MLKKEHNDERIRKIVEEHYATIDGRKVLWAIAVGGFTFSASTLTVEPGKPAYRATRLAWATILDTGKPGVAIRALDEDPEAVSIQEATQRLHLLFGQVQYRGR